MTQGASCINKDGIGLTLSFQHQSTHADHTKLNIYTMEQKHRDILIRNRIHLSRELKAESLAQYLYEVGIFTRILVEDISCHVGPTRQAFAFLDMLPCRGPQAFELFLQGLAATGQHDIIPIVTGSTWASTHHIQCSTFAAGTTTPVPRRQAAPRPVPWSRAVRASRSANTSGVIWWTLATLSGFHTVMDKEEQQTLRIRELEQTLRIVQRQLDQFQSKQMRELELRSQTASQLYRDDAKSCMSNGC
jgi:hypothetical protein